MRVVVRAAPRSQDSCVIAVPLCVGAGKLAYFRSGWNILDCVVVAVSIASLAASDAAQSFSFLRALRTLRALRPLKMISKHKALRQVVVSLLSSLRGIANVLVVCSLFFLVFGIIGVTYLKGAMRSCNGDDMRMLPPHVMNALVYPERFTELHREAQSFFQ